MPHAAPLTLAATLLATTTLAAQAQSGPVFNRIASFPVTAHGDHLYLVERDNGIGQGAELKTLTRVALADLQPTPLGSELPIVTKEEVHDLIPDLQATGGYVVDKVEGFAVTADDTGYVVTDNDGVDDSSGETLFFTVGQVQP